MKPWEQFALLSSYESDASLVGFLGCSNFSFSLFNRFGVVAIFPLVQFVSQQPARSTIKTIKWCPRRIKDRRRRSSLQVLSCGSTAQPRFAAYTCIIAPVWPHSLHASSGEVKCHLTYINAAYCINQSTMYVYCLCKCVGSILVRGICIIHLPFIICVSHTAVRSVTLSTIGGRCRMHYFMDLLFAHYL